MDHDQEENWPIHTHRNPGAPSWSWASTTGPVQFTPLETQDFPGRRPSSITWKAVIVSVVTDHNPTNEFGWLKSCSMRIRGRIRESSRHRCLPELELEKRMASKNMWQGNLPAIQHGEGHIYKEVDMSTCVDYRLQQPNAGNEAFDWTDPRTTVEFVDNQIGPYDMDDNLQQKIADANNEIRKTSRLVASDSHGQTYKLPVWIGHEVTKKPLAGPKPPVLVTYDILPPPTPSDLENRIRLLEIFKAEDWVEGLVLLRGEERNDSYQRVGFFRTKDLDAFEGADECYVDVN
ncbi:hypothetical protein G7Y79_00004g015280 [Physcia stellaris]|nr:hypothetical protein G7Y79_00004g015280 [Physcia stellaris]